MKNVKNLFGLLFFSIALFMTSCGDDEVCDGKTCPSGQILDANSCDCIIVNPEPCDGKTCPAGQILDASTCNCVDTAVCGGMTCPDGQVLDASTCTCVNTTNEVVIDRNVESDETWTPDNIYILATRVTVLSGATLTIEPGTVIKGEAGAEANATALLVARGGKIMADGTASEPIIFTSVADEIEPGMVESPNLPVSINGLWGGLIILGNAPISADADAVQIEGIPPSDQNGLYGGSDPADNSGVLRYVSIRHGGTDIGEGNEINGLTLGGVGTGTVIDHVEVISNVDDGIEFFGGTVDATNLLVWGQGDDAYDCDQAYSGTIDNFIYIAGADSDHALELDGPEGSATGSFTLRNGSLKGGNGEYTDLRSRVECNLENLYYFGFSSNSDFEFDNNGVSQNYLDMKINLSGLEFNVSHLSEGNLTIADIFQEKVAEDDDGNPTESKLDIFTQRPLDASIQVVTSPTVGADKSEFAGWTLADAKGELDDFN
jgi:hypothetical protein